MIEHLHTTILVAITCHQPIWLHNIHMEIWLCQKCRVCSTTATCTRHWCQDTLNTSSFKTELPFTNRLSQGTGTSSVSGRPSLPTTQIHCLLHLWSLHSLRSLPAAHTSEQCLAGPVCFTIPQFLFFYTFNQTERYNRNEGEKKMGLKR